MKRKRNQQRLVAAVAGVGLGLVLQAYSQAAVTWSGPTTNDLWSNDANWGGTPVGGQDVTFGDTGTSATAGTITSTVDSDQTISSLLYNNTGTSFHTTQINAGVTLTINGNNALRVGLMSPGTFVTTNAAITGAGTLNINAPSGTFVVSNDNTSGVSKAVLDLHGLSTFNANVTNFLVGTRVDGALASGPRSLGDLILADTNTITATNAIIGWDSTNNRPSSLTLGRVNTFNVDTFHVAREKTGVVTMQFGAGLTDATMTLRGKAGGVTRTNFLVNDFSGQSNSATNSGLNVVDFRGGTLDAMIETLTLAVGQTTTGAGSASAVLYFSKGNLDVNTVILGKTTSTTAGAAAATGTLNISGGTVRATNIILASQTSAATATGILNITGGLVKVTGDITDGNGTGLSTLFIDGGTVDMKPAGDTVAGNIGTTTNRIDNFRVNGILTNAGNISVSTISGTGTISNFSGTLTLNSATNVAIANQVSGAASSVLSMNGGGTMSFATGTTLTGIGGFSVLGNSKIDMTNLGGIFNAGQGIIGGSGTLIGTVNLQVPNGVITPGSGTSSAGTLSITGDLNANTNAKFRVDLSNVAGITSDLVTIGGNFSLNGGSVDVTPLGPLAAGSKVRLLNYTGTKTGSFNNPVVTSNSRYTFTVDESTDKQVNLIVGGSNANLLWKGGGGNIWDVVASPNWNNNTEKFFQADAVTFDDTSTTASNSKVVTVSDAVFPASIVVNSGTNYTFTGAGRIGGSTGITKSGAGVLAMNLTGGNDFAGAVNIQAGTYIAGSTTALGNTTGATTISPGATLDVNAQNLGAEVVTVGGAGVGGLGAIVNNSTTGQNNALRFVTMTGDTTFGGAGRWDIRANTTATLNMANSLLTKIGPAQFSLVGVAISNPGNILVNGGGTFSIESTTTLGGSAANNFTVNGSTLQIFGLTTAPAWSLNLTDSTVRINSGTTNAWGGPVNISGNNVIDVTATNIAHAFNGVISGAGSINKTSVGPLTLNAANTYTGNTTVTAGTLKLGAGGSIATTPLIDLKAGATFDVSAVTGGFVLGGAQTLQGSGTVVGNFTDSAGARIIPGGPAAVGTLSFSNSASFAGGGTLRYNLTDSGGTGGTSNDLIAIGGNLSLAGMTTIEVNPLAALSNSYVLMTYAGTKTGNAANNLKVSNATRYTFALDDSQANQIILNVTGGNAAALDWVGGNTTLNWDAVNGDQTGGTPNWTNTATSTPDRFFQADTVHFGDSPNNTVTLVGALNPAIINMDGPNTDYTFLGAGKISSGVLNLSSGRKLTLANSGINDTPGQFNITNNSTLQVGIGGTNGNLGAGQISNDGALVINRSDTVTLPNLITGSGTLEQRGSGVLILSGTNNTFGGNVLVTGGTLRPTAATVLGNGAVVVSPGGTFDINGISYGNKTFTFSGAGADGKGAVVNTGAAQQNAFLQVTLAGDTTFGGDVRFDIRSNTNTTAVLNTNGQGVKLTKVGASQFSLVGTNVDGALGDIDVQGGIFSVETTINTLGNPDSNLTLGPGTVLQFFATTNTLAKKMALNGATIRAASGTTPTSNVFSGPISVNAPSFIDTNGGNFTVTGTLSGTNTLTKIGGSGNTLILNGDGSAFTGAIVENAGTITVSRNSALGSSTASVTLNNTTATFGGTGTRLNLTGDITVDNVPLIMNSTLSGVNEQRTSLTSTGNNTWNGPISVTGISPTGLSCDSGTFTVNGNVSGPQSGTFFLRGGAGTGILNGTINIPNSNLFKTDNNTWVINSTGNSAAAMGVAVGTLQTGIANALPPTAILTMGQSDGNSPTLDLNGFDQTVGGLAVIGTGGSKKITNTSGTLATLTVNVAPTNSATFGGLGLITGNLGLTKTGAGSQALTSAQTYTGPTTVSGGTLSVSGSIATSSGVTVNNASATFDAAAAQRVKALTISAGQARVVSSAAKIALTVGDGTISTSQLSLTGGRLDLMTNGLAVDYAAGDARTDAIAVTSVRGQIIAGFGVNKDWLGNGITSANAAADKSGKAIGYALASEVLPFANGAATDTFLGSTVDASTVVARYTLGGDATLDGVVDFNDLVKLAQNYNTTVSDITESWWNKGDFTYDGITDFNDLVKLAQNYNTALPTEPIPGATAGFEADLARAFASVPEPGTLSILGIGGLALLGRRRRRRLA